jgi:hypothetical protein
MRIIAVTTFHAKGYELYGKRMIETFDRHWSCGVELIVYHEGWTPSRIGNERYLDLLECSPWLADFKKRNAQRNRSTGFRHDAVRFSHKVAALCHALWTQNADYVIWLDGDVVTHADFDIENLLPLLPEQWITWLDRTGTYPECGFYIINCRHPQHEIACTKFEQMYTRDYLFDLHEWHDSYVLMKTVEMLKLEAGSLSGQAGRRTHHPLVNGPLGQWFDHLKGKRKEKGKSLKTDFAVKRTEDYWQ